MLGAMRWIPLLVVAACTSAPAGGGGGGGNDARSDAKHDAPGTTAKVTAFDPAIKKVVIEIDYETGQAPYTGPILGFGDTFDPSVANLNRLFANKKPVMLPRTTAEMQDIGA